MIHVLKTFPLPTGAECRAMALNLAGASFAAFLVGGSSIWLPVVLPVGRALSLAVKGALV